MTPRRSLARPSLVMVPALSIALSGCYLSHELPICTYDVPEEERCLTTPEGADPAAFVWTGGSFVHRDLRAGCIAVSIDPAMLDHRERMEDAMAVLASAECAPCLEALEVVATEDLPPGPRIHLAPDGACEGAGPSSTGCDPDVDLCRGTVTRLILSLPEGSPFAPWTTDFLAASALVSFGFARVFHHEVRGVLSPRAEALLCAVNPPDARWCPGS